jgi:hypothetical protein
MIAFVPIVILVGWFASALLGLVRPGAEVSGLRQSLERVAPGGMKARVCVNLGGGTFALTRFGAAFSPLPVEAKAAIASARGADIGVFELDRACGQQDLRNALKQADGRMLSQGWERVVGVMEANQLVAVYCPRKGMSLGKTRVCVLVVDQKDVVIVCARANLESLQPIVSEALKKKREQWPLALCPPAIL